MKTLVWIQIVFCIFDKMKNRGYRKRISVERGLIITRIINLILSENKTRNNESITSFNSHQ